MFENNLYQRANITGNEAAIGGVLNSFLNAWQGQTPGVKRIRLPILQNDIHAAVDYIQERLPIGIFRVDGYCVEPLLQDEVDDRLSKLPNPPE